MELVTKKSNGVMIDRSLLIKSQKEARRKTLKNRLEAKGLVTNLFPASFIAGTNTDGWRSLWG
jgi:hypothetical protein